MFVLPKKASTFFSSRGEKRKFILNLVIQPGTKTTHKYAKSNQNKMLNHLEENQESFSSAL